MWPAVVPAHDVKDEFLGHISTFSNLITCFRLSPTNDRSLAVFQISRWQGLPLGIRLRQQVGPQRLDLEMVMIAHQDVPAVLHDDA
jgi:hypothetical protein